MCKSEKPNILEACRSVDQILRDLSIESPPVDLLKIADSYGIQVNFLDFRKYPSAVDVSGFCKPEEGKIFVNNNDSGERQAFTIAHELGHCILHKGVRAGKVLMRSASVSNQKDPREQEANAFAANLLVPRAMLLKVVDRFTLPELAKFFGVSKTMMSYRVYREMDA